MVKPLTVYKASAGSGKTFTLAVEYIRLVVENPLCFRNILAVTFTNKATEEMKRRILGQLYGIWKSLPESDGYLEKIRERTGLSDEVIRERAGMALHHLIHHYNEFRVMTIDTFFQSVLRNLARELDISATLRIGLNDYQVEEMAVDRMIDDLKVTDVMLQWLMRYILDNISDDKSWNVIRQIKQFGRTIFKDEYKAVSTEIQQKMEEPGFFEQYTTRLKEIRQAASQQMQNIADEFFGILEQEALTVDDFSFGKSGVAGVFQKLREGAPFDESLIGKRALDSVGDASKWYKKTHPQRERIHMLVESQLDPLLRRLIENRPQQWCLYKSADLTLRHLSQLRLLGSIEQKVRHLNEEANRFLLSDTQQLLQTLIDGSDSPFIFEKIGAQLQHVMIDEFQDTSVVQWQNFKILLAEAISHQQSGNLIVGDVKQSIYRWRSGDWRLLNDIETQFPHPDQQLTVQTLDTNYRSARRIIEFNNAFFTHAAELEYLALGASPEADQLRKAYADVVQQIPSNRPTAGRVSITLLPDSLKGQYKEQTLQDVVSCVSGLLAEGARPNEIAILVRSNALIPLIAQHFMLHMPEVSIISDEAFRLDASSAVCTIIDALRLLSRPNDLLTKATLVKRYQRQILGNNLTDTQLLLNEGHKKFNELLPEEFTSSFNVLRSMPLYELVERLYRIFALDRLESQSAYICTFFDYLTEFLKEETFLGAFLKEWDETISAKTIQSDEITGIRLISIHKSKGLEFPHVIIPFCDWPLEHPGILWAAPNQTDHLPLIPVDYSQKQLTGTVFEHAYQHEHLQNTVDNLNLLYVAFTRASQTLTVLGKRNAPSNSRSSLIEQVLPLLSDDLPDATLEGLDAEDVPIIFRLRGEAITQNDPEPCTRPHNNPFLQAPMPLFVPITSFPLKVKFLQSTQAREFLKSQSKNHSS
ncbi:MAG: UvrD-helicase domain-containing protein [Prevotella sp.]|nr:UvrD-helicase domain-containing protein [Prevotella sp.]